MTAAKIPRRPSRPSANHPASLKPEVHPAKPLPSQPPLHAGIRQCRKLCSPSHLRDRSPACHPKVFSTKYGLSGAFYNAHPLFSSTYKPFSQTQGDRGCVQSNIQMISLFFHAQKGGKPRLAWGEAIPGLGGEPRGLGREELVKTFSGASSLTPPLTRQLRCPAGGRGNGATTQLQTLVNRVHGEHADLPQLFISKIRVFFSAGCFGAPE